MVAHAHHIAHYELEAGDCAREQCSLGTVAERAGPWLLSR